MLFNLYDKLKNETKNKNNERIFAELDLLLEINRIKSNRYEKELDDAIRYLEKEYLENGVISKKDVLEVEYKFSFLSGEVKKYKVILIGHAHIDVNWMWGIDKTLNITMNTFETMLNLMDRYKDFTFMQSQAYLYDLIAKYRPDLIERIKRYVKE